MRALLAITSRELQERRLVLVAALALGLVAVLLPLLPHVQGAKPVDIMIGGAIGMAFTLGIGTAIFGGASMIGRDLAERRASFYLARPVRTISIWGGKMLAAVLLAIAAFCLTLAPAFLLQMRRLATALGQWEVRDIGAPTAFLMLILVAVGLGHHLNIALRSRSAWAALDLIAPVAVALLCWVAIRWLAAGMAIGLLVWAGWAIAVLFVVALWVASAVGFVRGRGEVREVHRVSSVTLWSIMAAVSVLFVAYAWRLHAAGMSDLARVRNVVASEDGRRIFVFGRPRGGGDYLATFYFDPASGRSWRIGSAAHVVPSADGRTAVWLESSPFEPHRSTLVRAELGDGAPRIRRTRMTFELAGRPVLSPDGSRVAVLQQNVLGIWNLGDQGSIATAKVPVLEGGKDVRLVEFVGNSVVRAHLQTWDDAGGNAVHIFEFDLATRTWRESASVPVSSTYIPIRRSADGNRLLVRGPDGWTLYAGDGELVARLGIGSGGISSVAWAVFLPDGGILARNPAAGELVLFTADGARVRGYPAPSRVSFPTFPGRGSVVFAARNETQSRQIDVDLLLLDLASGSWRKVGSGLRPAFFSWWNASDIAPGSFASNLYFAGSSLVWFDPFTGERRTIAGDEE